MIAAGTAPIIKFRGGWICRWLMILILLQFADVERRWLLLVSAALEFKMWHRSCGLRKKMTSNLSSLSVRLPVCPCKRRESMRQYRPLILHCRLGLCRPSRWRDRRQGPQVTGCRFVFWRAVMRRAACSDPWPSFCWTDCMTGLAARDAGGLAFLKFPCDYVVSHPSQAAKRRRSLLRLGDAGLLKRPLPPDVS